MTSIYYTPEEFGLRTIAEIELSSGSWEFDLVVVWRDAEGRWLVADDSGCSCPTPFEAVVVENIPRLDSAHEVLAVARDRFDMARKWGTDYCTDDAWAQFAEQVMREDAASPLNTDLEETS